MGRGRPLKKIDKIKFYESIRLIKEGKMKIYQAAKYVGLPDGSYINRIEMWAKGELTDDYFLPPELPDFGEDE